MTNKNLKFYYISFFELLTINYNMYVVYVDIYLYYVRYFYIINNCL